MLFHHVGSIYHSAIRMQITASYSAMLTLAVLLCSVQTARAQAVETGYTPRLSVGFTAALSVNTHTMGVAHAPDSAHEHRHFESGEGVGVQYGIAATYQFARHFALDVRTVFDSRPAHFEENAPAGLVMVPGTNEVVEMVVSYQSDVEYRLITTDIMFAARLPLILGLSASASAGPSIGVVQKSTFTRWQQLESPENAQFVNPDNYPTEDQGRRIIYDRDAELPNANAVRLSAKVGAGLDALLLGRLSVGLGLYYDLGLTNVTSTDHWKVNSFLWQVGILIPL